MDLFAVSYTHLDVYKRQVLLSAGIAFGAQYLYEQTLEEGYQAYLEKNAAEEGSVGAVASEDIPLAETLARCV